MGKLISEKKLNERERIAQRVLDLDADVLLVQEVEDQTALEDFNSKHLGGRYEQVVVLEGNDDRFIDVGIMLRGELSLGGVTTWKHATHPESEGPIFSRDLLQADLIDATGEPALTVFNTHLKSHFVQEFDFDEHRPKTAAEIAAEHEAANERRRMQAETTAAIIERQGGGRLVLAGDMNDPPDSPAFASWLAAGLTDALPSAVETQPPPAAGKPEDNPTTPVWSHRFPQTNAPDHFHLYDHLWVSEALEDRFGDPKIHRRSTWTTDGSDHDPVSVRVELPD